MDPSELEFLVEDKLISIIPNFSSRVPTHLISGSIEPFRAGLPLYGEFFVSSFQLTVLCNTFVVVK